MTRLASLYLPGFPLQVAVRERPELAGRAIAVTSPDPAHRVVSLSRRALEAGVRRGMGAGQARVLAPDLEVVGAARDRLQGAMIELAEDLAALSPVIEVGDAAALRWEILLEVPRGERTARFARRVLA